MDVASGNKLEEEVFERWMEEGKKRPLCEADSFLLRQHEHLDLADPAVSRRRYLALDNAYFLPQ